MRQVVDHPGLAFTRLSTKINELPTGQMPAEEFEALIEDFISQRSGEDDRLPGDVFFELLGQSEQPSADEAPVRAMGQVLEGQLVLTAPPGSPLCAEGIASVGPMAAKW